jgi:hydroxyacylglutathione hydrolase
VKLTPDIYLVGSGALGFDMSSAFDCHIYAIVNSGEIALLDAGSGLGMADVIRNLEDDGLDPAAITTVFVTHYHIDHAGALARWRELTDPTVVASQTAAAAIRTGDARTVGLQAAKEGGFYPDDYILVPCQVDVEASGSDRFSVGELTLTALETPGHCDGHLSFLLEGSDRTSLLGGDVVFWGGRIMLQNIPDCRIDEYAASVTSLAEHAFDALLPGHLTPSLRDGKRHVDAAAHAFRSLAIPPNLIQL